MSDTITVNTIYGPTNAEHWYLSDEEQMWQALKELIADHGHRGTVMMWPDSAGNPIWQFEANDDKGRSVTARIGQHLVLEEQLWAYDQSYFESIIK